MDEPIVWYEGSGTTVRRWLHADERGSIVAVSDGSGNATAVNSYNEYGIPAPANSGRFGYAGQAWLPELGMSYYRNRSYSPTLRRFMQTDPIGYGDGMNIYAYVSGDPVNFIDPTGTCQRIATWYTIYKGWSNGYEEPVGTEDFEFIEFGCNDDGGWSPSQYFVGGGGGGGGGEGSSETCTPQRGFVASPLERAVVAEASRQLMPTLGRIAIGLGLILSLSGDTLRQEPQYIIRAGIATPEQLIRGSRPNGAQTVT